MAIPHFFGHPDINTTKTKQYNEKQCQETAEIHDESFMLETVKIFYVRVVTSQFSYLDPKHNESANK